MKTKLGSLIVLCSAFATTAVFGQPKVFIWTNSAGGDVGTAANWNPNGVPNPRGTGANNGVIADVMLFDGQTIGPLSVRNNLGGLGGASGAPPLGLTVSVGANQTSPLTINTTLNGVSPAIRFADIFITNGAGPFNLGDTGTTNTLLMTWGTVAGQIHHFVNDSANPATIYPNAHMQHGGGGNHLFVFDGTGNWNVTGSNAGFGSFVGNVIFTNNPDTAEDSPRTLILNRPDNFTFSGTITTNFSSAQNNRGVVQQNGSGRLTLTGNNTYASGTVINAGTLQVGAGGGNGSLGTGPVTDNSVLVFNRTGTLAVGTVTGGGSLANIGTGTVTLTGNSSVGLDVDLEAGTFGAAPVGAIGSLSVGGNMTIASGVTVLAGVNRSLSPSNSVYNISGLIEHTNGGSLKLVNSGPLLQVGDKLTLFNQPVTNMTIVSPGFTVQNDLGLDGSVTVTVVQPAPTITATISGNQLNLSWDANWTGGVHLQAQTNSVTKGVSTNWVTIPGTDAANTYSTAIGKTNGTVFFRLVSP